MRVRSCFMFVAFATVAAFHQTVVATNLLAFSEFPLSRTSSQRMDWNWRMLGYVGYFLGYFPTILGDILFFGKYDNRIWEKCPKKHDIELEKVGKSSFQFFVGELVYTWYTFTCCRHDPFMHIVQDNHAQCVAEM